MLAVSTAGWVGMGFIEDINRGTMDRLLISPIWRGALNLGSIVQSVLSIVIQSAVVVGLALVVGARFQGGVAGVVVLVATAALLGAVFASLSNGLAVLVRQRDSLIGAVTMVVLPLTFLSSAVMQESLLPAASSRQKPSSHHSIDPPTPITSRTGGSSGSPNGSVQRSTPFALIMRSATVASSRYLASGGFPLRRRSRRIT
jgi:ABC-type multidrug transport system permease subunit